jgi:hypothetical protein
MPEQDRRAPGQWGEWALHVIMTLEKLEERLDKACERIAALETHMAVFNEWRRVQGEPTAEETEKIRDTQVDLRIEVAKLAVRAGGIGAIAVIVVLVLKALGVI